MLGLLSSIVRPNQCAESVWTACQARAAWAGGSIAWVVLRDRLSALDANNKCMMADVLGETADRLEFTAGPGFGKRVIFRELFLQGLTLSDFEDRTAGLAWTDSHVAARQELRDLLERSLDG
jgi:chromosome partitioning protein